MMRGKPRAVTTVVDVAAVPCHIVVRATLWTAYVVVASWLLIFIYTAVLLARALDYMEGRHERIGCLPGNPDRDGN